MNQILLVEVVMRTPAGANLATLAVTAVHVPLAMSEKVVDVPHVPLVLFLTHHSNNASVTSH